MTRAAQTTWKDFLPLIGALSIAVGAIYASGQQTAEVRATVAENTRRIEKLEAKNQLLEQIDRRTTRIEAKLEMIAPDSLRRGFSEHGDER